MPLPISFFSTAEPKSIIFTSVLSNFLYKVLFPFFFKDFDLDVLYIFFVLMKELFPLSLSSLIDIFIGIFS